MFQIFPCFDVQAFPKVIFANTFYELYVEFTLYVQSSIDTANLNWKYKSELVVYLKKLNFNLLKPTGYVMHHQFNIQQLYVLPTLYLCTLYLSENKQRLVPLTA